MKWALIALVAFPPGRTQAEQPVEPLVLSLDQAVSRALRDHPALRSSRQLTTAARHEVNAAASRPNPTMGVAPFRSSEHTDLELEVTQVFEISGRRELRTRVARRGLESVSAQSGELALEIAYRARVAFIDLLAAKAASAIAQQNVELVTRVLDATQKQFEAGDVPQLEVIRQKVELSKAKQEALRAAAAVARAKVGLNGAVGRPADAPVEVTGALSGAVSLPETETAALRRPILDAASADILQAEARVELERAARRPDLAVGLWRNEDKTNAVAIAVEFPLLDLGSIRNSVRRAESLRQAKEAMRDALAQEIAVQVRQSRLDLRTAQRLLGQYETTVLQPAERLMQMAQIGYREGLTGGLEVIDAQRSLTEARREHVELVAQRERAKARLLRALGVAPRSQIPTSPDRGATQEGEAQ